MLTTMFDIKYYKYIWIKVIWVKVLAHFMTLPPYFDWVFSMPIHVLQCVFHAEKLFCTHRFFHKYEQTRTEKFAHALLLIPMRAVYLQRLMMSSKYSRQESESPISVLNLGIGHIRV